MNKPKEYYYKWAVHRPHNDPIYPQWRTLNDLMTKEQAKHYLMGTSFEAMTIISGPYDLENNTLEKIIKENY